MTNETIPNLYEIATSPKLEKKLHHRYVPMMMYAEGGQEVIIPLVVGTARELSDAEVLAEKDTETIRNSSTGRSWQRLHVV